MSMKAIAMSQPPLVSELPPSAFDRTRAIQFTRGFIWLYLILLIFEGVLRKWIVPQLSTPLLIVRDPVVLLIYAFAWRGRVFPRNIYVITLIILAIFSWVAGIVVLLPYLPLKTLVLITGYGMRCNFLHLPLIFVIPAVMNLEDVKRIGWWTIVGMIPMAILMAAQFNSSPDSFINRAAGAGEATQIQAGGGRIRPPAVFSFISGSIYYLSATAAFLLHAVLAKLPYRMWLLSGAGAALIVGLAVSGSRSAILAVGLVVASLGLVVWIRPEAIGKFGRYILLVVITAWGISYLPIFREGVGVLSDRFTESAQESDTGIVQGLISRTVNTFTEGAELLDRVPLGGYGLGVGTNGGASLLTGRAAFLLAENEWSRILLESGPILGVAFLAWRSLLTFHLGYFAFRQLTFGNMLPLLLYAANFFVLLEGPFGQPTSLGFAVVFSGLCLAARVRKDEQLIRAKETALPTDLESNAHRPLRRSPFAEQLHQFKPHNGSLDR